MHTDTHNDIRVSIDVEHITESSVPDEGIFAFSYTVQIENVGLRSVQLLERHWIITSGSAQVTEIVGPGVLGEQPVLEEGEIFEYTSAAVLQDPIGFMEGSYTFRAGEGVVFEVPVPKFDLLYPVVIH